CRPVRSATEEEALERAEQLLAPERLHLRAAAVGLRDDGVVLEHRVRELVAFPDVVVAARLFALAVLRVHLPADRPHRSGAPLDPDDDALPASRVVESLDDPFGKAPVPGRGLHAATIQSRRPWDSSTRSGAR